MAKEKKTLSFSDFTGDDNYSVDNDENQDQGKDLDVDTTDDDLEDKAPKDKKTNPKGKSKQEKQDDPDEDEADDNSDASKDVDKKKDKKKGIEDNVASDDDDNNASVDDDNGLDVSKFFEEVEKITGTPVEVDYGDIDPLTPQGIALRDKALKEKALESFIEDLKVKFPQAYNVLDHAFNGGDITELFTQTTGRDYSKVELKEGDNTLAKEILKEYYKGKGVKNESKINKLIEADEDSDLGLVKEAQAALDELKSEQEAQRSKIIEQQRIKDAEQKKKDTIFVTAVDEVLESKKLGNFRITDRQEAVDFRKFVLSNLERTSDGYAIVTPVSSANLEAQLQYAYFQFKKGDLSKIIQQKAATENAKKLQVKFSQEQQKSKKTMEKENKGFSLKDF